MKGFFLLFLFVSSLQAGVIGKANKLFKQNKFSQAQEIYGIEAQKRDDPRIFFNLGNAEYKLGNFKEAEEAWARASEKGNSEVKSKTFYNFGNYYFEQGQYEKAAEMWKKSLIENPSDEDARYNLEVALKKIKQSRKEKDKKENEEKEEEKKQEARRTLKMLDKIEKEAKKKMEFPEVKVEKDW